MTVWKHGRTLTLIIGHEPARVARDFADVLDTLPDGFRKRTQDGESLDDFARFLREDAARGCSFDDVDVWLNKVRDWGDEHGLFFETVDRRVAS